MKTLFRLIVLVLMLGGWVLAAAAVHVVRTPETLTIVPKNRLSFSGVFVDTRVWTLEQAAEHPRVVARLLDLDKSELLKHLVSKEDAAELEIRLREVVDRGEAMERESRQPTGDARQNDNTDWLQLARSIDLAWQK